MKIADIAQENIITVSPQADIGEAAAKMSIFQVGALIVIEKGKEEIMGIVTERDVVIKTYRAKNSMLLTSLESEFN